MSVWLLIVDARRKLTDSSEVVNPIPAGALVSTDEPSAISATNAVVPARKTPAADCHQALAGIQALTMPRPTSDSRKPVSLVTGGSGSRRSKLARSRSRPDICSTSGPHVEPCGGSRTVSGITGLTVPSARAAVGRVRPWTPLDTGTLCGFGDPGVLRGKLSEQVTVLLFARRLAHRHQDRASSSARVTVVQAGPITDLLQELVQPDRACLLLGPAPGVQLCRHVREMGGEAPRLALAQLVGEPLQDRPA